MRDIWTETTVARLRAMIGDGLSAAQAAKRLSVEFGPVSRCAVIGKARRLASLGFPQFASVPAVRSTRPRRDESVPSRETAWSEAETARLRALVEAGLGRHAIAQTLGAEFGTPRTGKAVAGRVERLGACGFPQITVREVRAAAARPERGEQAERKPPRQPLEPNDYDRDSRNIALMDLARGECRWPVTDDPGGRHLFCGLQAEAGGPYCDHHAARSFGGFRVEEAPRLRTPARDGRALVFGAGM